MNKRVLKNIIDNIIKLLSYICLVILFFVAVFLIFYIVSNQSAKNKGIKPLVSIFTIVSESMVPNINVYDVIIDTRVSSISDLSVGDIITFKSDFIDTSGYTITHRIDEIDTNDGVTRIYTKGDNNALRDEGYITFNNIEGKVVFMIPKLGKIHSFISSKFGWLIVIFIPALGIIIMDLYRLIKVYRIKNQLEDIPRLKEVSIVREKEQDKKMRAVLENIDKFNKENNEEK